MKKTKAKDKAPEAKVERAPDSVMAAMARIAALAEERESARGVVNNYNQQIELLRGAVGETSFEVGALRIRFSVDEDAFRDVGALVMVRHPTGESVISLTLEELRSLHEWLGHNLGE
jgi:hypothetical protein